ncbi:MAG: valine--tRNA ligase [Bordetella sp.]|nr:MAG: valine--tRNA ligase [Bordetella sp.]
MIQNLFPIISVESEKDLTKNFEPNKIESYWSSKWEKEGFFHTNGNVKTKKFDDKQKPFFIQFPPPNVTGNLHMGHAFNQTIMDSIARYQRMSGKDLIFIPGTDHAGIATQLIVERQMDAEKISRYEIGREKFLERIWDWKDKSRKNITTQIRRLGTSTDWSREYFTMDKQVSNGVIEAFVKLYNQGLIYRGKRLVNWDPILLTAISDLEVKSEEIDGYMVYVLYPFSDGPKNILDKRGNRQVLMGLTIATTRPETIPADSAICVHPNDDRYKEFIGKTVNLPLCDRKIPIISDEFVDIKFGTGCVKITGAHDFNDYTCSIRHNLSIVSIFTPDCHMNDNAPEKFQGLDRFDARKLIIQELQEAKYLVKIENHKIMQPIGDRSGAILEPMLTNQWFMNMTKPAPEGTINSGKSISEIGLNVVEQGLIKFYPKNWKNIYVNWLNNIEDWCISRQLWWGHQIPAWYSSSGKIIVASNKTEAIQKAKDMNISGDLKQDPDVLDTWFSSSLIPLTTFGWPKNTIDLERFLSSGLLVSGFDIIFFWVARMIMMSTHLTGQVPFKDICIHGLVCDSEGQKMSKSKGNTLDPIDLIDGIELKNLLSKRILGLSDSKKIKNIQEHTKKQYPNGIPSFGTDALRLTMASYATPGYNINFDLSRCEGYRNFCNKLWNAGRFILINIKKYNFHKFSEKFEYSFTDYWIISRLEILKSKLVQSFSNYRLDNIANYLYHFMWNEYCDWYLEFAKVQIENGSKYQRFTTFYTLITVFESFLRLAHPIIPFITEELWQKIFPLANSENRDNLKGQSISLQTYPALNNNLINEKAEFEVSELQNQIEAIRTLKERINFQSNRNSSLIIKGDSVILYRNKPYFSNIEKVTQIRIVDSLPHMTNALIQTTGKTAFMFDIEIDVSTELERLSKQITQLKNKAYISINKLKNSNFVNRAPETIVNKEKNRLKEFLDSIEKLKEQYKKIEIRKNV